MEDIIASAVVRRIVEELDGSVTPDEITPESHLRHDLGLDSLQGVTLIMNVEEEFGISITDEELAAVRTVGDVVRLIRAKLEEKEAR